MILALYIGSMSNNVGDNLIGFIDLNGSLSTSVDE